MTRLARRSPSSRPRAPSSVVTNGVADASASSIAQRPPVPNWYGAMQTRAVGLASSRAALIAFLVGGPARSQVRSILREGDAAVATVNLVEALDVSQRL